VAQLAETHEADLLREELRKKSRFLSPFSWLFKKRDQLDQEVVERKHLIDV